MNYLNGNVINLNKMLILMTFSYVRKFEIVLKFFELIRYIKTMNNLIGNIIMLNKIIILGIFI